MFDWIFILILIMFGSWTIISNEIILVDIAGALCLFIAGLVWGSDKEEKMEAGG